MISERRLADRGYVIAQGTPSEIAENKDSETGLYLSGRKEIKREHPSEAGNSRMIAITGIHGNNLKNISIQFPVNAMTCITGVSGSGKSTLVNYGILPAVRACAEKKAAANKKYDTITGAEDIRRIVHITQKPIGRSSQSTPATYTGLMDEIRILFPGRRQPCAWAIPRADSAITAKTDSVLSAGDRVTNSDAAFMLSAKTQCHLCKGRKFNENTLQVHYKEKNIAQVLDMSIREAAVFFDDNKKLSETLQLLNEIGLGYLTLGQSSLTLSGGEAQRIKLAAQLQQNSGGNILYLLDEPTAGLHFSDIRNLLILLEKIISNGNTVIVVEHNPDMIRSADWVIDLGPEGGDRGGRLVEQGTVSDLKKCSASHTGRIIKAY
ncbi:MAG: ATP-binding cassette domain-containing protein [Eisenbergiella sp.]